MWARWSISTCWCEGLEMTFCGSGRARAREVARKGSFRRKDLVHIRKQFQKPKKARGKSSQLLFCIERCDISLMQANCSYPGEFLFYLLLFAIYAKLSPLCLFIHLPPTPKGANTVFLILHLSPPYFHSQNPKRSCSLKNRKAK